MPTGYHKRGEYMNLDGTQGAAGAPSPSDFWKVVGGFFGLGLVNNAGYVIMIAGAKDLDSSMVGVIFLCSVFPSACVKASGPYWYHLLSYRVRVILCSFMMAVSFITVAVGRKSGATALELLGVSIGSAQSGMGEASFLALCSYFTPPSLALNGWSSGTGFAGIFGYGWVIFFQMALNMTFSDTLYVACAVLPLSFWLIFEFVLGSPRPEQASLLRREKDSHHGSSSHSSKGEDDDPSVLEISQSPMLGITPTTRDSNITGIDSNTNTTVTGTALSSTESGVKDEIPTTAATAHVADGDLGGGSSDDDTVRMMTDTTATLSSSQRFKQTLALWPYMVPLAVVYFAEYAMQAGVWASMGFPVSSQAARKEFYQFSNWVYQAGVLVARSSGFLWTPTRGRLWVMPVIQMFLFVFFLLDAFYLLWNDWSVVVLCFLVGLQGGAVYVGGFTLISREVAPHLREFSLSAASLADSFGIVVADICAIFIQRALYTYHGISDQ